MTLTLMQVYELTLMQVCERDDTALAACPDMQEGRAEANTSVMFGMFGFVVFCCAVSSRIPTASSGCSSGFHWVLNCS